MFACCIKHNPIDETHTITSRKELWLGKLDFFMSVMGFNIGLGNLLRFPYLCMKNGGGAFLIPYFFFLITIGIPMFLMEMSLAQYSGFTPLEFYGNICPLFKGIGWCNVIGCAIYNIYYNLLMAWTIFYLGSSMINPLPWQFCNHEWNTEKCQINQIENLTITDQCKEYRKLFTTPSEEYWEKYVLNLSSGIGDLGSPNPITVLCLIIAWCSVFACVFKGIKSMGRVVYVTALSPYVFLVILLIKGCTLEGGKEGILFYLHPKLKYLLHPKVWMEAAQQIFWSLAPGWGITINLASHNPFNHNIYRDSIMLPIVSCLTSFLGGFVIFAFLGHIAYRYKEPINCAFKVGPGLAFNVYPEALQLLPFARVWCCLFFLLLFVLGLDSSFTSFETVYDSLKYSYPRLFNYDLSLKLSIIFVSFLICLPLTTRGGYYLFQLIDYYQIALFPLIVLVETLVISYFYGTVRVRANIETMTGHSPSIIWDIIWKFLLPLILLVLFIFTLVSQGDLTYGSYKYPIASVVFGWGLAIGGVLPIPVFCIIKLFEIKKLNKDHKLTISDIKKNLKCTSKWTLEEIITATSLDDTIPRPERDESRRSDHKL